MLEPQSGPLVMMDVEVAFSYDVTRVLDDWTLDEVREFVDDQDEEGVQILRETADQMEEDQRGPSFTGTPLEEYLAWREANAPAAECRNEASS